MRKHSKIVSLHGARGITLIALIVTIIMLLILAGVSLNLVAGSDGILGKASNAVIETKKATIKEEVELLIAELQMDYYENYTDNKSNYSTALAYAKTQLQTGNRQTGSGVTITYIAPKYYYNTMEFEIDLAGNVTVGEQTENAGESTTPTPSATATETPSPSVTSTPEPQKFTLTYHANGGDSTPESTSVESGTSITLPTLTRTGYNFLGWSNEETATTADYTSTYTVTKNTTLYAVWKRSTLSNLGISNSNIGDYIDLQNDPLGTGNSATNWRVFYVDGNDVYAILADYLPNSTGFAASAGLNTGDYTYSVYSEVTGTRDLLTNTLKTTSNWSALGNVYSTNVTGSPNYSQLKTSWNNNSKMTSQLTESESKQSNLTDSTQLYIPHTSVHSSCSGYWLALPEQGDANGIWMVHCGGHVSNDGYKSKNFGLRPVVCLSSSTFATSSTTDGVTTWTLSKE